MKKHNHPIDDLFREALEDHQMVPSEAVKKAFLRDVIQVPFTEKNGRRGIILLSVLFVMIGTGILIWAITSDKFSSNTSPESKPYVPHTTIAHHETESQVSRRSNDKTANIKHINTGSITREQNPVTQLLKQTLKQQASFEQPHIMPDHAKPQTQVAMSQPLPPPVTMETPAAASTTETPGNAAAILNEASLRLNITHMKPIGQESVSNPPEMRPDSIILPGHKRNGTSPESHIKHSNWIPTLGIYYNPEWMFNTLEGSKFVNNFGVEGTFHFDRFSVRTGAGLSIGKGTNELIVEYNDFLGSYNKLDSMQFAWDDPAQQFVPKYYLSKQEVYDSLMKLDYNKVVKRYTYLQIPLIMGYDFWQTDRISIGFRIGPVMSVLLASKQLSAEYDSGNKRIISINDISPGQISLNWQVMAGINTSIRLTKGLLLEVEPSARYYFNSVYQKPDNSTRPWSIGIRAAFIIKL